MDLNPPGIYRFIPMGIVLILIRQEQDSDQAMNKRRFGILQVVLEFVLVWQLVFACMYIYIFTRTYTCIDDVQHISKYDPWNPLTHRLQCISRCKLHFISSGQNPLVNTINPKQPGSRSPRTETTSGGRQQCLGSEKVRMCMDMYTTNRYTTI